MQIEELLNNLEIPYTHKGADYIVSCLNPDHEDSNPSMRIDMVSGIYHCFSCGFKGNLLRDHGYELTSSSIAVQKLKDKIEKLLKSELNIPENATPFKFDYRDISNKTLLNFEAFTSAEYPDRLVFPIRNISGKIEVFLGRHLFTNLNKDKYKFDPGGVQPPLFPAKVKPIKSTVILVEGIFDVLNLYDKGLQNVICGFGTHTLFKNYKEKLEAYKILGMEKLYIMFDGDKAGLDAAEKLEKTLNGFIQAERIELPKDLDPGDLTQDQVSRIKESLYGL